MKLNALNFCSSFYDISDIMPLVRKCCHIKATDMEHASHQCIVGVPHQFNMDELQEDILKEHVVMKGRLQGLDQIHVSFCYKDEGFSTSGL